MTRVDVFFFRLGRCKRSHGSSASLQSIEIYSDTEPNILLAIKVAKSFIALNSFKLVQCGGGESAAFHRISLTVGLMQCVERGHVTLPQINSYRWVFLFRFFVKQSCTYGELRDSACSIREAKQWKTSLKAPWLGKVTWNQIHGCRLLLHTSHVALMTLDIFWNFSVFASHYWQLGHVHNPLLMPSNAIKPHQCRNDVMPSSFLFSVFCFVRNSPERTCPLGTLGPMKYLWRFNARVFWKIGPTVDLNRNPWFAWAHWSEGLNETLQSWMLRWCRIPHYLRFFTSKSLFWGVFPWHCWLLFSL